MRIVSKRMAVVLVLLSIGSTAWAQTADEVIEKSLTALGGRIALGKLKTRSSTGSIAIQTPAGNIAGSIEVLTAAPNKSRSVVKADLSALGAGQLEIDTRCDGTSGYTLDSLQGNRDITGNQLDNLKNNWFPHPFFNYKSVGTTAKLDGKEKLGARDAYVLTLEPTSGSTTRAFIDAETFLPVKTVTKIDIPQVGGEVEQTTEFSDYREVDGMKIPFRLTSSSSVQSFTIDFTKVEHNMALDAAMFSKPK